jgi:hypothetical protein
MRRPVDAVDPLKGVGQQTANAKAAIKEEKPVVALIRDLSLSVANAIQVSRHHDLMTRFFMITFSFNPSN